MNYVILAVNMITLLLLTAFVVYSIAKGHVMIVKKQVLDKETSMKLAKVMEDQMKQGVEY